MVQVLVQNLVCCNLKLRLDMLVHVIYNIRVPVIGLVLTIMVGRSMESVPMVQVLVQNLVCCNLKLRHWYT